MKHLDELHAQGVSIWLDSLNRDMFSSGQLGRWIELGLRGLTSNPSIFQTALASGAAYDEDVARLAAQGLTRDEIAWALIVADVQAACDQFATVYQSSGHTDGFVSLELDPTRARDTAGSIEQARRLWKQVDRPNLMLKVPGTREGLPVLEALIEHGCHVNVTLLFDTQRYREVMQAHARGLKARLQAGLPLDDIAAVASFFVSRVDTEVDKRLDTHTDLSVAGRAEVSGKVAIANARQAYRAFGEFIATPQWQELAASGAQIMRPLWASTGVKSPDLPDTLYVDALIGPHCVNTLPEATLLAVLDHGGLQPTLGSNELDNARQVLQHAADAGLDMNDITQRTLEEEGLKKFADAYAGLLATLEQQIQRLATANR